MALSHGQAYDVVVTNEEALMTIATLASEARQKTGETLNAAAQRMLINYQTLRSVEQAERLPKRSTYRALERGYGWAEGSLMRLWDRRQETEFGSVTAEQLLPDVGEIDVPLSKARDLTTPELLAELSFRVLMMSRGQEEEPQ